MKIGELDIIGNGFDSPFGVESLLNLLIKKITGTEIVDVTLDADEAERLIIYLEDLRDGCGWNHKSNADRSL